jgi:putative chitinase
MKVHFADLALLFPATPKPILQSLVTPLNAALDRYDISTGARIGSFLAQAGHESGGFAVMTENLNYSSKALRSVFGKYFPSDDLAEAYARQPQKIASRVYANRMGNGNEASKDGWAYRGRGYIQLTGKENYQAFADAMKITLSDAVGYLETQQGAAMSAAWFWHKRGLNGLADRGQFDKITLRINGGMNGYEDRLAKYEKAKGLFG